MDSIKIYIDEDAMDSDLVIALRSRVVAVLTPLEVARTENADEAQLAFATERGCVLYSHQGCFAAAHRFLCASAIR